MNHGSGHYFRLKGQRAEEAIHELADRTFLTDWCYPNPKRSDGDELCDLLVVFDDCAIIWQVKDLKLDAAGRYKAKEVEKNLRQLGGARRILFDLKEPITLSNPRRGEEPFDPSVIKRVFLVSVLMGEGEDYFPFAQAYKNHAVHVLTREFAPILMLELDTATDFIRYLEAKEELLERELRLSIIGGEEELLAYYILHQRSFSGFENADAIVIDEGAWRELQSLSAYTAKRREDEQSYVWDSIIDWIHEGSPSYEVVARELARLDRFQRRTLGKSFLECRIGAHEGDASKVYRHVTALEEVTYCFLFMDDPEPRTRRKQMLGDLCYIARGRLPLNQKVVGIATERTMGRGFSYDFCLLEIPEWTDEHAKVARELQETTGILANATERHVSEEEFPGQGSSEEE